MCVTFLLFIHILIYCISIYSPAPHTCINIQFKHPTFYDIHAPLSSTITSSSIYALDYPILYITRYVSILCYFLLLSTPLVLSYAYLLPLYPSSVLLLLSYLSPTFLFQLSIQSFFSYYNLFLLVSIYLWQPNSSFPSVFLGIYLLDFSFYLLQYLHISFPTSTYWIGLMP